RVYQEADYSRCRDQFPQQFNPFRDRSIEKKAYASDVAAWAIEAVHKAGPHGVVAGREDYRNCCGCRLGGKRCNQATSCDNIHLTPDQLRGCRRRPFSASPAVVDRYILSLDVADFAQALSE